MRDLTELDDYRVKGDWVRQRHGSFGDGTWGVFVVPSPSDAEALRVVAATLKDWDRVSVAHRKRAPNAAEMGKVRDMFFGPGEVVVQFHHPGGRDAGEPGNILHLWRVRSAKVAFPPTLETTIEIPAKAG